MILEVIKDAAPLSEGTLVSVAGSFKYDEKQDPFHKLIPTTFEDANFIRLNGVLGMLPKENFQECTVTVSNKKHPLYGKTFSIYSLMMENPKTREVFEFMSGVVDPLLIKEINVDCEGYMTKLSLGDTQLSFIDNEKIEAYKEFLRYIDREEYEETFTNEWADEETETEEESKIAEQKFYFIHNTGTMTVAKDVEYEVVKFMKKNPDTGDYDEVPQSRARVAQILVNGTYVTVLLRNGNIVKH